MSKKVRITIAPPSGMSDGGTGRPRVWTGHPHLRLPDPHLDADALAYGLRGESDNVTAFLVEMRRRGLIRIEEELQEGEDFEVLP